MKKILIILTIILVPLTLSGQLNGLGTIGSPFNGTFGPGDNLTWSGTVYVDGDIIVDNEQLTISPGTTIVFTTPGADLIITGTGQLNANGTALSQITFTKGTGNSSWGHISFQNMTAGFTGASIINYCIVEYGQKNSSPSNIEGYGGGIHAAFTFLTISNSIVRNNYAGWGGGIFVNSNYAPSIVNCLISNNTAANAGGGLYFYQHTSSIIINCIIEKNTAAYGGGGVFLGAYSDNVRFFNCVFVSNYKGPSIIDNIYLFLNINSYTPKFYNSIVWGSDNSITYQSQTPSSTDFNYCAIQGYTTGYTSCINLSGTNADPTGPNFVDPNNLNYAISFISPCRDAGISTGAPLTDYMGNSRIGPYDIGAYEVQYSRWNGSSGTDWTSGANWDSGIVPIDGTSDIIIPSGLTNYPTGSTSLDYNIGALHSMILNPGAKATFRNLTNGGSLKLESDASQMSTLITSNSRFNATIDLYLSGRESSGINTWHYISSPVSNLPVSTFVLTTIDLAQYVENLPTPSNAGLIEGWIGFDGYNYTSRTYDGLYTFNTLDPGKGYDYYYKFNHKYTFTGALAVLPVSVPLAYTGATPNSPLSGFNLIGNPFPAGLDWDVITAGTYPSNTSKAIHFTQNNVQLDYVGGVGTLGATGIIPPMQGFFVKCNDVPDMTLALPTSARTHFGYHATYKKGSEIIPLVRLSLTENSIPDETVVRFDDLAKSYLDNDFDALKLFLSPTVTSIYSSLGGVNYSINGLPFPQTIVEIPISVNLVNSGNHSISTPQLQGLDNYNVTLTDKSSGFIANLKTTPNLTFSASAGSITDRFILKITNITTGVENPVISNNKFNIFPSNDMINIQTVSDIWDGKSGSVKIIDLTGKTVNDQNNTEFSKNSVIQVAAPVKSGIYVVEIKSGVLRYVGKVVIR